jgi:hypothetical protein
MLHGCYVGIIDVRKLKVHNDVAASSGMMFIPSLFIDHPSL